MHMRQKLNDLTMIVVPKMVFSVNAQYTLAAMINTNTEQLVNSSQALRS